MKKIIASIISIYTCVGLMGQTSNIDRGCAPLTVDFQSPAGQAMAFWDFGDGGATNQLDPSHTFDDPGVFTVELFTAFGGAKVGEVVITVFEDPQFMIGSDVTNGCAPLTVNFMNQSVLDPGQVATGYLWDFGDGNSSTDQNPTHVYTTEDKFSVTLRIESNEPGCTQSQVFDDYITTSGMITASFSLDQTVACEVPADFKITNNTVDQSAYTYLWDFGNGETSTEYNPGTITYTELGTYTITMMVDNGDGCVVTRIRTISIGKPEFFLNVPDTICIDQTVTFQNNSIGNEFVWSFGDDASPSESDVRSPEVRYDTPGAKNITLSVDTSTACRIDTFFRVFVEDPRAAFTIEPFSNCNDPATYTFTHPNPDYASYIYIIKELEDTIVGTANQQYTYTPPKRDSFYINRADTFKVYLTVTTHAGCSALDSTLFIHRAPQAHFIPNISRGCAPLTVNFTEDSRSTEDIVEWSWIFGDGDVTTVSTGDNMTHTYTDPGEYYVKIAIENEAGCRDTSAGIFIYVGEPVTGAFTVDKTEICLYETITMEVTDLDPRVDAYHFNTDDGRISDCYRTPEATHTFIHSPGTYPLTLTAEYNGCFTEIDDGTMITVNGSKARIRYMTNCEDPLTVMLQDSSVNASSSLWYINGDTINMDTIAGDVFNYTFDSTGDYTVKLVTTDDSPCDPDSAEVTLYIRDIKADFDLPEYVCAFAGVDISAAASIDVDSTCSKGYTWYGMAIRPRTLDVPEIAGAWQPGPFSVTLITEDVNGCTDTLTKHSIATEINAQFVADKDTICYPVTINFTDESTSDTTIVSWEWSFGAQTQNPFDLFAEGPSGTLPIGLKIEDELGCRDSIITFIHVYEPTTDVEIDPGPIVCVGTSIDVTATDFTEQGSFLDFMWTFAGEQSEEQNPSFDVDAVGTFPLNLIVTEDATGCTNEYAFNIRAVALPIAEIATDDSVVCFSDPIVPFQNLSQIDGPGAFFWDMGNGQTFSNTPNALGQGQGVSSTYKDGGSYDITLTASSIYGCSDTDMITIEVIEPSAQFTVSDDDGKICVDDLVTFTLTNAVDVDTFLWDFGDGTVIQDVSPVSHTFSFVPPDGDYDVVLSLISEEGCKTSVDVPLEAFLFDAVIQPDSQACLGIVEFSNFGAEPTSDLTYQWDFGNGMTSNDKTEAIEYEEPGTYTVTLQMQFAEAGCNAADTIMLIVSPNPTTGIIDSLFCKEDDVYVEIGTVIDNVVYTIDPDPMDAGELTSGKIFLDPTITEYLVTVLDTITGCETLDTLNISVIVQPTIPNLFSPNGDGHNDFFDIVVPMKFRPLVETSTFKVYNRWGNLVYDNETPDKGWSGLVNGDTPAPAEVYTYVIVVGYGNGTSEKFKGTVTLIY